MRRFWPLFVFASTSAACGAFFDLGRLGADADAPLPDGGREAAASDASPDAAPDADASEGEDSSAPCVYEAGAPMRRIGGYCIDSTEVTNGQYAEFLARTDGGATAPQNAACGDDVDRVPPTEYLSDPLYASFPVQSVSYCDAWSYCKFAGKRLCGRRGIRGGASLSQPETTNPEASEWYRACSKAGTKIYPYGNQPIEGECALDRRIRQTGRTCEGGYAGIFDMVGNVAEWIDSCDTQFGNVELCVLAGGDTLTRLSDCKTMKQLGRHAKNDFTGFRCCAD